MADQEQMKRLLKNVKTWNTWRVEHSEEKPDLSGAKLSYEDLSGANLSDANLSGANLSGAKLSYDDDIITADLVGADLNGADLVFADLSCVDLSGADLSDANLDSTNLSDANLSGANLSGANLSSANFSGANLKDANLSGATIGWTSFGDRDLREIKGLETVLHEGPTPLSINSLYKSEGNIPESFLRGTGAQDTFIDYVKSLASNPIEYYSCFISYSSKDQAFAERLFNDLQGKGVRCWYAPEHLKWGERIGPGIDEAIRKHEKLLLILSKHSLASGWVEREVETALAKEKKEQSTVLFPLRLDQAILECPFSWATEIRHNRNIGNFTRWKDHDAYQQSLQRLLRDFKQRRT